MTATRSLLITLTGRDRPGVSSALFESLSNFDVAVIDVEQVTIHGRLTLAALVTAPDAQIEVVLRDHVASVATTLGLECSISATGEEPPTREESIHVTVIGSPLLPAALSQIASTIASCGANIDRITRLATSPVTAIELEISGSMVDQLRQSLTQTALQHAVDIAVQRGGLARRAKRLVVMDVDSTLIQDEVIDLLAERAGVQTEVAAITDEAMNGKLDFAQALQARVALLSGLPESALAEVRDRVRLTPGATVLIQTLQRLDHHVGVVSGGFIEVISPIVKSLGIDLVRANSLEVKDGLLTGRVVGPIVDRHGKALALRQFAEQTNTPLEQTVAIGDGANDLDMIAQAGLGVAFNAKQVLRESADTSISAPYLDSVLYLLGIPSEMAIRN